MPKKKSTLYTPKPPSASSKVAYLTRYEITEEPIQDRYFWLLSPRVQEAIERICWESQTEPRGAIPQLRDLIERYPKMPMLYTYLTAAYLRIGQNAKAEAVTQKCLKKYPDYLFARINYADFCLQRKEYDKIAEIFDHKFDLHLLYPDRKQFHIAEVANFIGLIGLYFYETHERELAKTYNDFLQEIAPDYPIVQRLRRKLSPNRWTRLWRRLRGG